MSRYRGRERGADYLDGKIMAIPPMIGQPEAVVLYGGSEAAFEAHQPTLANLGASTYLGADPGLASLYDLALLGIMWSTLSGFYHAVALVGTEKIAARAFTPMAVRWLSAVAGWLPEDAQQIDDGDYATDVSTVGLSAVALGHLVRASRAQGIGIDVPSPLQALVERAAAEGHGADSLASLIEVIKRSAPMA